MMLPHSHSHSQSQSQSPHFTLSPLSSSTNNNNNNNNNPSSTLPPPIRLSDITPFDGSPTGTYLKAVEALSSSLMRHNAAVLELGSDDAAVIRCGFEASRLYFKTKGSSSSRSGVSTYRAGRAFEDGDSSPPCMAEIFRCLGKAARAAIGAIARHLRLRSDVFNHLLDDTPLPANEVSSSVLVATYSHASVQNGKGAIGGGKPSSINGEFEKGLLTLICSDGPGLQVCDPNGRWYVADNALAPGSVVLLTGKALSHATAGLRPPASYRSSPDNSSGSGCGGRISLAFRLMPQSNAVLDCSLIAAAGHVIPQSYVPVSVSQFLDDLSAEEDALCNHTDSAYSFPDLFGSDSMSKMEQNNMHKEPSLRSVLSDPLSGGFLDDAVIVSCGHSFGGLMLRKVVEASRCTLCHKEIDTRSLIPNHALRAAASAVKEEDDRRLFYNAALRKRRKDVGDLIDSGRRTIKENGDVADSGLYRGVQYPFSVNEKVMIRGNRRTPDKFVGKEAVITSQCLNGWYLLKIVGSGESVRLQYRSLRKLSGSQANEGQDRCVSEPIQTSS